MDVDLAVATRRAGHHLAIEPDGQDVVRRDLVESDRMRLHVEARRIVRQPHRDMTAGEIVLPFADQHLAGPDQRLLEFVMRHEAAPNLLSPSLQARRSNLDYATRLLRRASHAS